MPIYEFSCAKCGKLAEVMQRVGERPPPCPSCGSKRMTRAVSRTAFHLKGGGWYADLYGTPRPDSGKTGVGKAEAGTTGGADAKTGAAEKPAATTATPAKAEGGEKPVTSKPGEPTTKKEATPKGATSPPERRPGTPRKRR
jgi:putative FmdB family regulatory protein